jgi:hypothetical protein
MLAGWISGERTEHFGLRKDDDSDIALATRLTRMVVREDRL